MLGVTPDVAIIRIQGDLNEVSARLTSGATLQDRDRALAALEQITATAAEITRQLAEPERAQERRGVAQALFSDEQADAAWQRVTRA